MLGKNKYKYFLTARASPLPPRIRPSRIKNSPNNYLHYLHRKKSGGREANSNLERHREHDSCCSVWPYLLEGLLSYIDFSREKQYGHDNLINLVKVIVRWLAMA